MNILLIILTILYIIHQNIHIDVISSVGKNNSLVAALHSPTSNLQIYWRSTSKCYGSNWLIRVYRN